jgi:hypothetical protein
METPTDEPTPNEQPRSPVPEDGAPPSTGDTPQEGAPESGSTSEAESVPTESGQAGGSYEDSWYQVLKRRSEHEPPADDQQSKE